MCTRKRQDEKQELKREVEETTLGFRTRMKYNVRQGRPSAGEEEGE